MHQSPKKESKQKKKEKQTAAKLRNVTSGEDRTITIMAVWGWGGARGG